MCDEAVADAPERPGPLPVLEPGLRPAQAHRVLRDPDHHAGPEAQPDPGRRAELPGHRRVGRQGLLPREGGLGAGLHRPHLDPGALLDPVRRCWCEPEPEALRTAYGLQRELPLPGGGTLRRRGDEQPRLPRRRQVDLVRPEPDLPALALAHRRVEGQAAGRLRTAGAVQVRCARALGCLGAARRRARAVRPGALHPGPEVQPLTRFFAALPLEEVGRIFASKFILL